MIKKYNNKKSGMTLMELLVVIVIIGILVTFGMVAIKLMSKDYAQRKLPQSMYTNLKNINAEILVRNTQKKRSGFYDSNGDIEESFIPGEKRLPAFGSEYCEAFRKIANQARSRFSCGETRNVAGKSQTGGGDIGNEMYIIGLKNDPETCWDGRQCIKVYVSIKQDADDNPLFEEAGSINENGNLVGVVDHFGFNIYANGDVEPMIDTVSGVDGSTVQPYGAAADMVTVDVVVESVDEIYRERLDLLSKVIEHAVVDDCNNCDINNKNKGDKTLSFHNTSMLNYFVSTGTGKTAKEVTSDSSNFVTPVMTNDNNGTFCEFGMACRVGFVDNSVSIDIDENGQAQAKTISIPDFRQKQMNDANVLLFKIPYRRAVAIKNRLEFISFRTASVDELKEPSSLFDTCSGLQNDIEIKEAEFCLDRRLASIKDEDMAFLRDNNLEQVISSLDATNYCRLNDENSYNQARKRRICRLIDISLR